MPRKNQKTVTLSEEIFDKLKELSERESRSMPSEIAYLVKARLSELEL